MSVIVVICIKFLIIFTSVNAMQMYSPNYFCADMNPQHHIDINQLLGMWYGIEIIEHSLMMEYHTISRTVNTCPILHISEEQHYSSDEISVTKTYQEDFKKDRSEKKIYHQMNYQDSSSLYNRNNKASYARSDTTGSHQFNRRRYGSKNYPNYNEDILRRIRIWWDEDGKETEYRLKYNISRPGFWFSSKSQNDPPLETYFNYFTGTVQVLKAVGNHLVLTFCYQLPERKLLTILLSRHRRMLDPIDIHGVHSLLNRKGLNINNIKQVCNRATNLEVLIFPMIIFVFLNYRILTN